MAGNSKNWPVNLTRPNGCPNPQRIPASGSMSPGDTITFNNLTSGTVSVNDLDSEPTSGEGCPISTGNDNVVDGTLTVSANGSETITIPSCSSNSTYEYHVSGCGLLGNPPEMIVGG